jgi:excisionase family DNA binding protein
VTTSPSRPKPYRRSDDDRDAWMTVGEAAEYLGVSKSTLNRWQRSGRLVTDRRTPGGWRLYSTESLLLLKAHLKAQRTVRTRQRAV